jgi:hypothetical protein
MYSSLDALTNASTTRLRRSTRNKLLACVAGVIHTSRGGIVHGRLTTKLIHIANDMLQSNKIGYWNVIPFLKYSRELLELTKSKNKFKVVNFYCNWAFHPELDKGAWLAKFFENLNDAVQEEKSQHDCDHLLKRISEEISLNRMRFELIDFLNLNGINGNILKRDDLWFAITITIVDDLIDKKLKFPKCKESEQIRSRIKSNNQRVKRPVLPEEFAWYLLFSGRPGHFVNGMALQGNFQHFCDIEIVDGVIINKSSASV